MEFIDQLLNKITMYRLVLYYLILLLLVAEIYAFLHILSFSPSDLAISVGVLLAVCWITNTIFAKIFHAPTNNESANISALILALIITPIQSPTDLSFLIWAGALAMASKYIFAINKKHIFNPVAIAVVLTAFGLDDSASWWVGTLPMLPFVLLGLLIVRKIRRFDLVYYFFIAASLTILGFSIASGGDILSILRDTIFTSSIFFFGFVMLTEPLTTPPTKPLQSIYGALVGILFAPQFHIGTIYTTPELSLVIGNIFSYLVSPKFKLILTLKEKIQTASSSMDFLFTPHKKFLFKPGQYMEWTLPHDHADSRGNRRYFTIASSPTENTIRLGVRIYPQSSSYKRKLQNIDTKTNIVAASLAGDFILPTNKEKKMVFLAGGIGITPFRSMLKYLIDTNEKRSIVVFYANKTMDEIVYTDVLTQAQEQLGIKTIYILTDEAKIPPHWQGVPGNITAETIEKEVPDYKERIFYLSGPLGMIEFYEHILLGMGIHRKNIKKDFFAGLA